MYALLVRSAINNHFLFKRDDLFMIIHVKLVYFAKLLHALVPIYQDTRNFSPYQIALKLIHHDSPDELKHKIAQEESEKRRVS